MGLATTLHSKMYHPKIRVPNSPVALKEVSYSRSSPTVRANSVSLATKPAQLQRHSITRSLEASMSENGSEDDSKTASRQL